MFEENVNNPGKEVRSKVIVDLYPNYLTDSIGGDSWIARTACNRTLNLDDVANSLVTRGNFDGEPLSIKRTAEAVLNEIKFLVANGMACNIGLFTFYPKVCGTFRDQGRNWDPKTNPVKIMSRPTAEARRVASLIDVVIKGNRQAAAYIDSFTDTVDGVINDTCGAGHFFTATGLRIKVEHGENPAFGCGLYFVPKLNPAAAVLVPHLGLNESSRIVAVVPSPLTYAEYFIRIVTCYSGGGNPLLEPRTIESRFTLTSI